MMRSNYRKAYKKARFKKWFGRMVRRKAKEANNLLDVVDFHAIRTH